MLKPPYHNVAWSDALEKIPEAIALTAVGGLRVDLWLRQFATIRPLTLALMEGFHRTIFEDVFPDFAGRLRGEAPRYIPQNVEFGVQDYRGFPGTRWEHVSEACESLFRRVVSLIKQLDDLLPSESRNFSLQVLRVAAFIHCEIVRIHPFMNGNGRTARICVNYFARRYKYHPLPFERLDESTDYLAATSAYLLNPAGNRATDAFVAFLRPRLVPLPSDSVQ